MNKKTAIAALAGGIMAFFLGWLIWGILLMDFTEANTTVYPGLFKEKMNMVTIFIGCLIWAFLIAWVYSNFSSRKSVVGGAILGAILGLLMGAMMDISYLGSWNLFTPAYLAVDVVANTVYSAGVGAVVGWILRDKVAAKD